jgi:predicted adenine nucleotide alpha hydrolase (AANH) superfamily ATPase
MSEKKLLLHICCGPCAARAIEQLQSEFDITGYFYNPNIEPAGEYEQRLNAAQTLLNYLGIKLISDNYDNQKWHQAVLGLEHYKEGGRRCWRCFRVRLHKTAEMAQKESIEYFATTLTTNPHKNARIINRLGKKIGEKFGVKFIEVKYKPEDRYKPSIARKLKLYHQKYCGCLFSAKI